MVFYFLRIILFYKYDISIDEIITTQDSDNNKDKTLIKDIDKANDVNIDQCIQNQDDDTYKNNANPSQELIDKIKNADNEDLISIGPGTYKIHNITLTKNIYIQGNGNPKDIILDGEKVSTIFFIKNPYLSIHFSNLTFINGQTSNFGGAICIETGNVYVDNCIFINNTALSNTNAGAISNYGDEEHRSYLFVNNSLFLGNYADHDGGAVTTCYADSDIYNSVFINNSARLDGGAIMVSGNLNLTESIIVNNTADETGGSFYIQQPMFDTKTVIKVEGNIITNNTAHLGEEIFVKWTDTYHLFTKFNNNIGAMKTQVVQVL